MIDFIESYRKLFPVKALISASILFFLFSGCHSFTGLGDEHYHRDFYFVDGMVQIQGRAELPPVRTENDETGELRFLSLRERRERCLRRAMVNGQVRWLSLTESNPAEQDEWKRRLENGSISEEKQECLDGATERQQFYDSMESCRVVVYFPCYPQNY